MTTRWGSVLRLGVCWFLSRASTARALNLCFCFLFRYRTPQRVDKWRYCAEESNFCHGKNGVHKRSACLWKSYSARAAARMELLIVILFNILYPLHSRGIAIFYRALHKRGEAVLLVSANSHLGHVRYSVGVVHQFTLIHFHLPESESSTIERNYVPGYCYDARRVLIAAGISIDLRVYSQ